MLYKFINGNIKTWKSVRNSGAFFFCFRWEKYWKYFGFLRVFYGFTFWYVGEFRSIIGTVIKSKGKFISVNF